MSSSRSTGKTTLNVNVAVIVRQLSASNDETTLDINVSNDKTTLDINAFNGKTTLDINAI